ncbi:hypothetical protein R3P38DRAFT_3240167 [Favolaschia claudopus]|uniref:Uncharacterized protein n=1 Tax=Favolaschia claudopus TaxID=2862362 RepID=A0AAV9Z6N0_9AGAR
MFWLAMTQGSSYRPEDLDLLAAYLPDLTNARGWLDVIYISSLVVLLPAIDHRRYKEEDAPEIEIIEAEAVCGKYKVFSPILLNPALALWTYHQDAYLKSPAAEVFQYLTPNEFCERLHESVSQYDEELGSLFESQVQAEKRRESFFLFDGKELSLLCLA